MMVRSALIAAAGLLAAIAAGPASAARVLYAYVDSDGQAAVAVTNGYYTQGASTTTVSCLTGGVICNEVDLYLLGKRFDLFPINNGVGNAVGFPGADAGAAGTYNVNESMVSAQLSVYNLNASDVVYSYVDSDGQAAIAVTNGYYTQGAPTTTVSCLTGGVICNEVDLYLLGKRFDVFPINNGVGNAVGFPGADAGAAGTYTVSGNGYAAQLTVVGPLATSVPEMATWIMLVAGVGTMGIAMRRRRVTLAFA